MKTIKQLQDIIMGNITGDAEPIDILTLLRENDDALEPLYNTIMDEDLLYEVYHGQTRLKAIYYDKTENGLPYTPDSEANYVIFQYIFPYYSEKPPQAEPIMKAIAAIMMSDCANCCNALDHLTISSDGIYASGNISGTYHS